MSHQPCNRLNARVRELCPEGTLKRRKLVNRPQSLGEINEATKRPRHWARK